jgi:hypothetical protein
VRQAGSIAAAAGGHSFSHASICVVQILTFYTSLDLKVLISKVVKYSHLIREMIVFSEFIVLKNL